VRGHANAYVRTRICQTCAREHIYALRFECALRSTADESFRSNALAIREKHAFADFYALLAARTRTRVYGTHEGEKHLTRIKAVNDAFRKRRDENVRVGQHSVSDSGSSLAVIEHQMRMCDGQRCIVIVDVVKTRRTKERKGQRKRRLAGQEGAR